ncbi:S-adenosylmethionine synthase, partial [Operophtera brumata]
MMLMELVAERNPQRCARANPSHKQGPFQWNYSVEQKDSDQRCLRLVQIYSSSLTVTVITQPQKVNSYGMLLLYRPRDITNECVSSRRLRYDISHGMGMSDTMTLFPGTVGMNCNSNHDAFTVMKKRFCYRICDAIGEADELSPYFVTASKERIRFRFLSNSSINSDINANQYQVTVTSARKKPLGGCLQWNETLCNVGQNQFCFTHGVVCDGINNCVIAVMAAIICTLLAAGHILLRCLPPLANSFFIFNANEDNRLCIDPVFRSPGLRPTSLDKSKRISLIP